MVNGQSRVTGKHWHTRHKNGQSRVTGNIGTNTTQKTINKNDRHGPARTRTRTPPKPRVVTAVNYV